MSSGEPIVDDTATTLNNLGEHTDTTIETPEQIAAKRKRLATEVGKMTVEQASKLSPVMQEKLSGPIMSTEATVKATEPEIATSTNPAGAPIKEIITSKEVPAKTPAITPAPRVAEFGAIAGNPAAEIPLTYGGAPSTPKPTLK
ncbi:MAG: hypothetical protein HW400_359 [Candidatus Levybacteria bacterium]|nr:hypothetical protein [Candidatus Levybacteria bacterium]